MKQYGSCKRLLSVVAAGALLGGCASGFVNVAPTAPAQYAHLGPATGSACGSLGVLSTPYYVVPMGLNSRVERAYANAVASVPGATALLNVTVQENWYWWLIGTSRCVTITGEAIK